MKEQEAYNKRIMALQNQYQQQAAAQSQQYAKDYWDYTNAENQVEHLKNAGLNVGLIYGQSGAGGMGASGGARQESPEQAQGNPVGMALQVQQIEQQRRMNDAQIALAEAQANKANRGDVWLSAAGDGAFVDRGVIDFIYWNAFKNLACAHLSCRTAATNNRAIRILERLGFKKEGVQRKAWDGETDAILLGLTPEDAYSCALEDI